MYKERYKSHHDAERRLKNILSTNENVEQYLREVLNNEAKNKRTVYIHIPFCAKRCTFCMLNKKVELDLNTYDEYLINKINQIKSYKYMEREIDSIYFGGGTPTALSPMQFNRVLRALRSSFNISDDAEISVETSISELSKEMLRVLIENRVNRLSIGVQTFNEGGRKLLGRRGSGEKAVEKIHEAVDLGIKNTNIDIIYNYPNQSIDDFQKDIEVIKNIPIAGLSFYSLNMHEGAPIMKLVNDKQMKEIYNPLRDKEFFDLIVKELGKVGYEFFELTKLIKNKLDRYEYIRIRQTGGCCIPIGHGAGGNIERYTLMNSQKHNNVSEDIRFSAMGRILSKNYKVIDRFASDLQRMMVDLSTYSDRLNIDLFLILENCIKRLEEENLIVLKNTSIKLTHDGIFWGNNIIDEFINLIIKEIQKQ